MTDNQLRQAIQKLLDSHTFSDQTAYSPALQEDLLMSLEALIRQDRRELLERLQQVTETSRDEHVIRDAIDTELQHLTGLEEDHESS